MARLFIVVLVLGIAGCGGQQSVPAANTSSSNDVQSLQSAARSPFNASRRFLRRNGSAASGRKIQGLRNAYWFPQTARIRKHLHEVYVVAYGTLFVFPDQLRHVDNESGADVQIADIRDEAIPQVVALAEKAKAEKRSRHSSSSRHTSLVLFGNCDVWDPDCICPDCSGLSNPWTEQPNPGLIPGGVGWGTGFDDPTLGCLAASGGDDTGFAACMAVGGSYNVGGFGRLFRFHCRNFVFFAKNRAIVLSTQSNPVRDGAVSYDSKYSGLIQGYQEDGGSLSSGLAIADFINYALFGSIDGVFATLAVDFMDIHGAVIDFSDATFASLNLGVFVAPSGPWSRGN